MIPPSLLRRLAAVRVPKPPAPPLLTAAEISALYARAQACTRLARSAREVAHHRLGDTHSVFRGQGLDFEENRPWQPGDELRFMNWRATARSGTPTLKVFREERRPGLFLLIDRRNSMRFGTRVRLKAAQALRVAALLAFHAERQQQPVAGLVLENESRWLPERRSAFDLIRAGNTPCPWPEADTPEPALAAILRLLAVTLTRGTTLWLISDFHDLDATCRPVLLGLAAEHALAAAQIIDPAEWTLPDAGRLALHEGRTTGFLDSSDPRQREACNTQSRRFLEARARTFHVLGLPCFTVPADEDAIERLLC